MGSGGPKIAAGVEATCPHVTDMIKPNSSVHRVRVAGRHTRPRVAGMVFLLIEPGSGGDIHAGSSRVFPHIFP